jgi:hypothetical protein
MLVKPTCDQAASRPLTACLPAAVLPQDRWYREKLGVPPSGRRQVVEAYIQGLHWVLEYYYRCVWGGLGVGCLQLWCLDVEL